MSACLRACLRYACVRSDLSGHNLHLCMISKYFGTVVRWKKNVQVMKFKVTLEDRTMKWLFAYEIS